MPKRKKNIKLNKDSVFSFFLGLLVVLTVGGLAFNYFAKLNKDNSDKKEPTILANQEELKTVGEESFIKNITGEMVKNELSLPAKHKIQRGESLWGIAEKYYGSGFLWEKIAQANNLTNFDLIHGDNELIIPKIEGVASANVVVVREADEIIPADATVKGDSYIVVKTDTLWSIAQRAYGDPYKWTEIAKANNLSHPGLIHANNVLILPR